MSKTFKGLSIFEDRAGRSLYYVRSSKDHERVVCWNSKEENGWEHCACFILSINKIAISSLKALKIWDKLTPERQKELEDNDLGDLSNEVVKELQDQLINSANSANSEKPKRVRRDYTGVPDFMVCKCGHVQKYPQSVIYTQATKKEMTVEDFVKAYQCQTCNPTKGRGKRAKKDYGDIPDHMTCECGHVQNYHPSTLVAMSEKKNISVEDMVKSYKCQKCNPTKGRKKGWKKS